jgi:outer membrane protein assembly factor BamB
MIRSLGIALTLGSFIFLSALNSIAAQSINVPLISQEQAQQIGLQRAWITQVPLDRARSKITHIKLQSGLLLVVTSERMLYVIDPESGQIQWSFLIGDRRLVALPAAANATHVAVANTGRVFVLDRNTGDVVMDRELTGTPQWGPVFTAKEVFLPLVKGPLEGYPLPLDENTKPEKILSPDYLPTAGRLAGDPVATDAELIWAGDLDQINAHLFGEHAAELNHLVHEGVTTGPAIFAPQVYLGTQLGYLIAYDAERLTEAWRFSTGSPIRLRPIAIGSAVFVLPEDGGMFALEPKTGEMLWFAPDPIQFVAASPQRVYTLDKFGRLTILDAKTGARAATFRLPESIKGLTNNQSDRLVLYTDQGLIQSLHETALTQPHLFLPPKPEPSKKGPGSSPKPAAEPAADAAPAGAATNAAAAPFTHFKVP